MTTLTFTRRTSAIEKGNVTDKICAFIAEHLGFDVECVTVDSHFTDDLGMDLLDIVELTILIEDQFTDVQITDLDNEIEFVCDLVGHIEILNDARARAKTDGPQGYATSMWRPPR
jgi:acyl carrier protein